MGVSNNEMETILAFALNWRSKLTHLGGVLEEFWRRPGGVSELSLGVLEGSEACVRASKGGKARLGEACQRFCDWMSDDFGGSENPPPPPGVILFFGSHQKNQTRRRHPEG